MRFNFLVMEAGIPNMDRRQSLMRQRRIKVFSIPHLSSGSVSNDLFSGPLPRRRLDVLHLEHLYSDVTL